MTRSSRCDPRTARAVRALPRTRTSGERTSRIRSPGMPDPAPESEAVPEHRTREGEPDDLALPYWLTSTEEAANTTFLGMSRRLPELLKEAWLLAWRAGPGTTTAVV